MSSRRIIGLLGEAGNIVTMRDAATKVLIATYCMPCTGRLWRTVPLPGWPNAAANDEDNPHEPKTA